MIFAVTGILAKHKEDSWKVVYDCNKGIQFFGLSLFIKTNWNEKIITSLIVACFGISNFFY